jgi:signal transduction histidine kinase/ActR/RegA family two-component response regulator
MSDLESMRERLIALQRRHDSAHVHLTQYAAIFEATRAILAAPTDVDIQAAMFRGILDASRAEAVTVLERVGDRLVCSRASEPLLAGAELGGGALCEAVLGGRALALPDIRRPPEFLEVMTAPAWQKFAGAALFPFQSRTQAGIVMLLSSQAGSFQTSDAERLKVFGMLAAQGMAALYRLQLAGERATADAARKAAVAADSAKSMFLASMSHEIRTPLNGVLGMAQALHADDLSPAQRDKVAIILDSGTSLLALLNDVLDFSKVEAGKMDISPVPGDFVETLERTRELFRAQAEDKGLELSTNIDMEFPRHLAHDPVRARQCISNLVSNAIKFTEKGRVSMIVSSRRLGDGMHMVAVDVSDTGIGIAPDMQEKLFTAFTQVDGSISRKFGGSGLGLAISRRLANLMGGDISIMSDVNQGSTFRFTFLAKECPPSIGSVDAPAPSTLAAPTPSKRLSGVRILLVDDNAINRQVIKLFLAPQMADIAEATNGEEALERLASAAFDIVLLDIHMPVMDGREAIRRIRAGKQAWSSMPVIALTADAMNGDRERFLAMGMSDYVSKPVDQRELVSKIYTLLGRGAIEMPLAKTGS